LDAPLRHGGHSDEWGPEKKVFVSAVYTMLEGFWCAKPRADQDRQPLGMAIQPIQEGLHRIL
jgi:hypothetical protein